VTGAHRLASRQWDREQQQGEDGAEPHG
jgi:hypothetical protein